MPELRVRGAAPDAEGRLVSVDPASAGWRHVGFEAFMLAPGARLERETGGRELCLVVLAGRAAVTGAGQEWRKAWPNVGGRESVFDGLPHSVYLPPGSSLSVEAVSERLEVALCWAPAVRGRAAALIVPEDCGVEVRGAGGTEREIHNILMEDRPAESLLVTEVLTPGGNWSSVPPHKHDTDDPPRETYLEETYYHRIKRPGGFAVQLVYTDDRSLDESLRVEDGDVVLVPRGYHPVSAAPGCDLYYLNVMAGPVRLWRTTTDPALVP
jgi:5-deoxy-glucuronate isomerase